MYRECSQCYRNLDSDDFSTNQWMKAVGVSRCLDCVSSSQQSVRCDICYNWYTGTNSLMQHMRTHPSCEYCDQSFLSNSDLNSHKNNDHHFCAICDRIFSSANGLFQHNKTHVPRTVSCPICGVQKFRNAANAVAHVESGYCNGCRGKDNARNQIYQFVSKNAPGLRVPMIENGQGISGVPERPYKCTRCEKCFTTLSAQMSHEGDVTSDICNKLDGRKHCNYYVWCYWAFIYAYISSSEEAVITNLDNITF